MNDRKIGAVIAVGGLSSRMKDFKPLLKIGGTTMIEQIVKNFRIMGVDQIVVVTGYNGDAIEKKLSRYNVTFVENKQYKTTHMFNSIYKGLKNIREEMKFVFLTPADSPFVQTYTLLSMIKEIEKEESSLIQPSYDGKDGHPLLLNKNAIKSVFEHDGTRGLQGVISKINSKKMSFVDPGIVMDADTPCDYFKLLEYYKGKSCPSIDMCLKIQDFFHMSEEVKAHCSKVAMTALNICQYLSDEGIVINKRIVIAASLLHDIAKGYKDHAKIGSKWLKDMGYDDIYQIVEEHMELKDIQKKISEKEVVFLADKIIKEDKEVTIEERFSEKEKIYKDNKELLETVKYKKEQALEIFNLIFNRR